MIEAEEAVKFELAQKYDKLPGDIAVRVTKIDGEYVAGSVNFAPGENAAGGLFLAYKSNGVWKLAYDGNGSINCDAVRAEGFSDLILSPQFCDSK